MLQIAAFRDLHNYLSPLGLFWTLWDPENYLGPLGLIYILTQWFY